MEPGMGGAAMWVMGRDVGCGAASASAAAAVVPARTSVEDVISPNFARAINSAAADLCAKLSQRRSLAHKNFVFFTPNILAAFSMLYAGAPAGLKESFEEFLKVKQVEGDYHASFGSWIRNLRSRSVAQAAHLNEAVGKFFFKQAQAILTRRPIPSEAAQRLSNYDPVQITFEDANEAMALTNSWVEKETDGKITNLVEELDPRTVLILVTAALYQGSWKYPFSVKENSTEVFYNADGTRVKTLTMNQGLDNLRLYSDGAKGIDICELPFQGSTSMLIINPGGTYGRGVRAERAAVRLREFMTPENLLEMIANFDARASRSSGLTIGIPKITTKDKTDLFAELASDPLVQSIKDADWDGSLINMGSPVYTQELISEVQFQMDEAGAQVAAASYSPSFCDSCDPEFHIRGPFGVLIFDKTTQTILCLGQFFKLEGEPVGENEY